MTRCTMYMDAIPPSGPCNACFEVQEENGILGEKFFMPCAHYGIWVKCVDDKLYRCPICRWAFKCWWCHTNFPRKSETQPHERSFFLEWKEYIWTAPIGVCGICESSLTTERHVTLLGSPLYLEKVSKQVGYREDGLLDTDTNFVWLS